MPSIEAETERRRLRASPRLGDTTVQDARLAWGEEVRAGHVIPPGNPVAEAGGAGVQCTWVGDPDRDQLVIHLHGGSYVMGSAYTHRRFAAYLSMACGCPVLLPDYRLAPENPFPAGLEDSISVYRWLIETGRRPENIVEAGSDRASLDGVGRVRAVAAR